MVIFRSLLVGLSARSCTAALACALVIAVNNPVHAGIEAFLVGWPAPDGNGVITSARAPVLNDAGQLAFIAGLSNTAGGSTASDRQGLFRREADGTIVQVARGGQAGPGGGGVFTSFGETPWLNDAGDVAFFQQGNLTGIYRGAPLVKIARVSEPAPVSGTFSSLRLGGMNDAGQISFHAFMSNTTPPTGNRAIYRGDGQSLVEIARTGSPVPGGQGTFGSVDLSTKVNEQGQVVFSGSAINPNMPSAIFRGDGISTAVIARSGQPAPALGGGTDGSYSGDNTKAHAINDEGEVAFTLGITGSSSGFGSGLFRGDGQQAVMILRSGLPAPDASGGTTGTFASWDRPAINNNGDVIVWAQLQGTPGGSTDRMGLFVGDGSTLRQIVRSGDPAPDGNGRLQIFGRNSIFNNAGQTAFQASHIDAAVRTSGGIYFYDPKLGLLTVARAGQQLFDSTIVSLMLAGHNLDTPVGDMETSGMNEHGQVAFQFNLANGAQGLAVWTPPNSDFNDDGLVNGDDLALLTANYGKTPAALADGDGNGDNVVDGIDFLMWQRQSTAASSGAANAVPEPNTALLTILAALLLQRRKW